MSCVAVCSLRRSGKQDGNHSAIKVELELFSGLHSHSWCRQCSSAPCAEACPEGSIRKNTLTGAWLVDPTACVGCGACAGACPFDAIFMVKGTAIPVKCDLCLGEPLCAEACVFGAIEFTDESEEVKE